MYLVGAGCIGLLHAHSIQRAGIPVTLLLRRPQALSQIRVSVKHSINPNVSATTTTTLHNFKTLDRIDSLELIDTLLVCTRANHTLEALQPLITSGKITRNSTVVLLQNGVLGSYAEICDYLKSISIDPPHFVLGSTTHGVRRDEPMDLFSVNHVGSGVSLFGPAIEQNDLPSNTVYSKLLSAEDLNVTAPLPSKKLEAKLLLKLAINSSLNPLTAIFNSPNGDISASMEGRRLLEELCEEIALLPEFKEGLGMSSSELGSAVTTVANATARNRNSMDATVMRGEDTEINYLNGYLLRLAKLHSIRLPKHEFVVNMVKLRLLLQRTRINKELE